MVAEGFTVEARQIEQLLRAADLAPDAGRVQELARAVEILAEARQTTDDSVRQVAVASLRLRGWLEAPARCGLRRGGQKGCSHRLRAGRFKSVRRGWNGRCRQASLPEPVSSSKAVRAAQLVTAIR
ncbi:MAG: hypothetical protein HZY76_11375 [Anaerolineae bacterium]|nr:MAG: hypothetical protein HZY76_11375 [Anaerolineae bacterium]